MYDQGRAPCPFYVHKATDRAIDQTTFIPFPVFISSSLDIDIYYPCARATRDSVYGRRISEHLRRSCAQRPLGGAC